MRKIKIICMHPTIKNIRQMADYLKIKNEGLIKRFYWEENDPDYVIVTEHIYNKKEYFNQFCKFFKENENRIFIFHGGESISPDLNIFDYAIVYDNKLHDSDRISRIPPVIFHNYAMINEENTISYNQAKDLFNKKKFCNFIYSNGRAHPMRDKLFLEISKYKTVDSLGRHYNNTRIRPSRGESNWAELSIRMKGNYKFSIAAENEIYAGYTTEKLLTSFQAHSVPIYWGNPDVPEEYNPAAFINCHDFNSLEEIVARIKEVDQDIDAWSQIISQPWQTDEQKRKMEDDMENYQRFIENIFSQDLKIARRRPEGTYSDVYFDWFSRKFRKTGFIKRLLKKYARLKDEVLFKMKKNRKEVA